MNGDRANAGERVALAALTARPRKGRRARLDFSSPTE